MYFFNIKKKRKNMKCEKFLNVLRIQPTKFYKKFFRRKSFKKISKKIYSNDSIVKNLQKK